MITKIHQHVKLVLALVLNFLMILKRNLDLVNLNVDNTTTELEICSTWNIFQK